jgi:uncharacterized protein (TIGR00297 family)
VPARRALLALGLGLAVALGGWSRGALSRDGAAAATLVGAAIFGLGGLDAAAALIAFFVSGSWLSRRSAAPGELRAAKGHRRDAVQVLANGGVAAAGALLAALRADRGHGIVVGAIGAAAADTWASEVGVRSRTLPRSIVSGRAVRPGTSGGVTPLGWLAAAAGALVVGLAYAAAGRGRRGLLRPIVVAAVAGLFGSLADSLAGATLQAAYRCADCGEPSESARHACGAATERVGGYRWVTNDTVNLIATAVGGLVGALTWPLGRYGTLGRASGRRAGRAARPRGGYEHAEGLRDQEHLSRGVRGSRARA